ncbi:hypothetical protein BP422_03655 [Brevibacillus formosus]|uniref:Uncharacterized protein n=1 Tax=Brevibacillus formosus TaxID=54913 RepID=A0A220MCL0_9BACL|nr:hypothetical protein BP422_03655 [Brevibacillus formosus]
MRPETQATLQKSEYGEQSNKLFQDYLNEWTKTKWNLGEQTIEQFLKKQDMQADIGLLSI